MEIDCAKKVPTGAVKLVRETTVESLHFLHDSALPTSMLSGALSVTRPADYPGNNPQVLYFPWSQTDNQLQQPYPFVTSPLNDSGVPEVSFTAVAIGKSGKIYLSDSTNGVIYRLTPPAK